MSENSKCPLCPDEFGSYFKHVVSSNGRLGYRCEICGNFQISEEVYDDNWDQHSKLEPIVRRILAHRVKQATYADGKNIIYHTITQENIDQIKIEKKLPNHSEKANFIISYFANLYPDKFEAIDRHFIEIEVFAGCAHKTELSYIISELIDKKILRGDHYGKFAGLDIYKDITLTLDGWERYEAEKRGKFAGNYGFAALKFNDQDLDHVLNNHIKPFVQAELKIEIRDMRDVAQAGIIDNIMRQQIRDSAFVIADLTHDNYGAYWEAGYAEGLGKPVIYICEESKFKAAKTHFDTNHCTTIEWHMDELDLFKQSLVATIRRSLNLFD
jgi:nucleoside 2-deoxyribosyltransferase